MMIFKNNEYAIEANVLADFDGVSNPTGRSYNTRFMGFAEFWYNRLIQKYRMGISLSNNEEIPNWYLGIKRFSSTEAFGNTGQTEKEWVEDKIKVVFETYFLQNFLKSKI